MKIPSTAAKSCFIKNDSFRSLLIDRYTGKEYEKITPIVMAATVRAKSFLSTIKASTFLFDFIRFGLNGAKPLKLAVLYGRFFVSRY